MTLPELKQNLNNNIDIESFLIFKYEDTDYIPKDYCKKLASNRNQYVIYLNSVEDIPKPNSFLSNNDVPLYVVKIEELGDSLLEYKLDKNIILIAKKLSNNLLSTYKNNIIIVPKLEKWQIESYILSICPGISKEISSWFVENYDGDVYKIFIEVSKLILFPPDTREYLFEKFYNDGIFNTVEDNSLALKLSTAIQSKDIPTIKNILNQFESNSNSSIEPMAFLSLLYGNFLKLIKVWLTKNPTQENTGLKGNQIWAINKIPRNYDKNQLIEALKIISSLDNKIKSGNFPIEILNDYLIVKLLALQFFKIK